MRLLAGAALGLVLGALSATALGQPIYVANPGESFGPIKLGQIPPAGQRIVCAGTEHDGMRVVHIYYLETGLIAQIRDSLPQRDLTPLDASSSPVDSVDAYTDRALPRILRIISSHERCITNEGQTWIVTISTQLPAPQAVYVTNKGARLGMTTNEVLAKHGAFACSRGIEGLVSFLFLTYEGLQFVLYNGRVDEISVGSYHPSNCR